MRAKLVSAVVLTTLALGDLSATAARTEVPRIMAAVPATAIGVIAVDYAELRRSTLFATFENAYLFHHRDANLDDFVALTGIDPTRDIESFVVALLPGEGEPHLACVVAGSFTREQILGSAVAKQKLSPLAGEGAATLYTFAAADRDGEGDARSRRHQPVLALPADGLAVFGDEAGVSAALATLAHGDKSFAASALAPADLASAGQVWGVLDLEALLKAAPAHQEAGIPAAVKQVRQMSFDISFGRELELRCRARADNDENADLLRQSVLGFIAAGKLSAQDKPYLKALLAGTEVTRDGKQIELSLSATEETLRHFADEAKAAASGLAESDR